MGPYDSAEITTEHCGTRFSPHSAVAVIDTNFCGEKERKMWFFKKYFHKKIVSFNTCLKKFEKPCVIVQHKLRKSTLTQVQEICTCDTF